MISREPSFCRREAFDLFARQLSVLDTTDGLLRAAIAVSMHALDDVRPEDAFGQLDALAQRVQSRIRNRTVQTILAHLHDVLFDEEGFAGDSENYYAAENSYIPTILDTHRGIPITLSLIYKVVAERAGLGVVGMNSPGHFLVQVRDQTKWMIIDPFHGGQVLTTDEALTRIAEVNGRTVLRAPHLLRVATHLDWISRLIGNLQQIFTIHHAMHDLAAMNELQVLLSDVAAA